MRCAARVQNNPVHSQRLDLSAETALFLTPPRVKGRSLPPVNLDVGDPVIH